MIKKRKLTGSLTLGVSVLGMASSVITSANLTGILNAKNLSESKKEDKLSGYTAAMSIAEKILDDFARDRNNPKIVEKVENVLEELIKKKKAEHENNSGIVKKILEKLKLIKKKTKEDYNINAAINNNANVRNVIDSAKYKRIGQLINLAAELDIDYEDIIESLINDITVNVTFDDTLKTNQAVEHGIRGMRIASDPDYTPSDEEIENIDLKKLRDTPFGNTEKYNNLFKNYNVESLRAFEEVIENTKEEIDRLEREGQHNQQKVDELKKLLDILTENSKFLSDSNRIKILNKMGYEYSSLLNNFATKFIASLAVAEALFLLVPASLPTVTLALLGWGICDVIGSRVANTVIQTFDPGNPTHKTCKEAFISSITPDEYSVNRVVKEFVTSTISGVLNLTVGSAVAKNVLGEEVPKAALKDVLARDSIQAAIGESGGSISSHATDELVDKLDDVADDDLQS